jgi:hypothetical protein
MIFYYTTAAHDYTLGGIRSAGHPISKQILNIHYESLLQAGSAQISGAGVHIFSDIDRLPGFFIPTLVRYRRELIEEYGNKVLFLNHPTRSKRRYELLKLLHKKNINHFDIYRLNEYPCPSRWPVFVRQENEHDGPKSPLLHSQEELDAFRGKLQQEETFCDDLVVIEFLDTSGPDGLYRKYSATRFGDALIPRHVFLHREWSVKHKLKEFEELQQKEEEVFLQQFSHRQELMDIFLLAEIDHGRIDYSFHEEQIQVWEINTNPAYYTFREVPGSDNRQLQQHLEFIDKMADALKGLQQQCRL